MVKLLKKTVAKQLSNFFTAIPCVIWGAALCICKLVHKYLGYDIIHTITTSEGCTGAGSYGGPGGGLGCVDPATKVVTPKGLASIGDLEVGDSIQGLNMHDGQPEFKVIRSHISFPKETYKFTFSNSTVVATADHPFMSIHGWKSLKPDQTNARYSLFENYSIGGLVPGDLVVKSGGGYDALKSVELQGVSTVISVKVGSYKMVNDQLQSVDSDMSNHNFYTNGLLSHNK